MHSKVEEGTKIIARSCFIQFCYSHYTPIVYILRITSVVLTSTLSTQVLSKVLEYKYKYTGEIKEVFK